MQSLYGVTPGRRERCLARARELEHAARVDVIYDLTVLPDPWESGAGKRQAWPGRRSSRFRPPAFPLPATGVPVFDAGLEAGQGRAGHVASRAADPALVVVIGQEELPEAAPQLVHERGRVPYRGRIDRAVVEVPITGPVPGLRSLLAGELRRERENGD